MEDSQLENKLDRITDELVAICKSLDDLFYLIDGIATTYMGGRPGDPNFKTLKDISVKSPNE